MQMHQSHNWRYSDSSLYDAVCTQCNCTDVSQHAEFACGNPPTPSKFLELAVQAGLKSPSELKLSPQEQKFAELIVEECARLCRDSMLLFDVSLVLSSTKQEMTKYTALELANIIERHFNSNV